MNKLFMPYLRRYGTRDAELLALYICAVIMIYVYYRHQFRYAEGLGDIRHKTAQCWVLWNAFYAFVTGFSGYQSAGKSYETMLLPASVNSKFIFTAFRIFVVMPVMSAALLLLADYGCCQIHTVTSKVAHYATSMFGTLTYAGSVFSRLPIMPYYLFTLVAIVLVLKTIKRNKLPIFIMPAIIIGFAIVNFGPHFEYQQYNYPFLAGKLTASYHGTTVSELVSWTSMGARTLRAVSYVFLLALPVSLIYLSYLQFKELEPER